MIKLGKLIAPISQDSNRVALIRNLGGYSALASVCSLLKVKDRCRGDIAAFKTLATVLTRAASCSPPLV
jgi:hypothetical protein